MMDSIDAGASAPAITPSEIIDAMDLDVTFTASGYKTEGPAVPVGENKRGEPDVSQ